MRLSWHDVSSFVNAQYLRLGRFSLFAPKHSDTKYGENVFGLEKVTFQPYSDDSEQYYQLIIP
jgi:hypothetical protein